MPLNVTLRIWYLGAIVVLGGLDGKREEAHLSVEDMQVPVTNPLPSTAVAPVVPPGRILGGRGRDP